MPTDDSLTTMKFLIERLLQFIGPSHCSEKAIVMSRCPTERLSQRLSDKKGLFSEETLTSRRGRVFPV